MTSLINNSSDNQEQVLQETEPMRPLFFKNAQKHALPPSLEPQQRLRLDSAVDPQQMISEETRQSDDTQHIPTSLKPSETTLINMDHSLITHTHLILQHHPHLLTQPSTAVPDGPGGSVVLSVMQASESVGNVPHFILQPKEALKQRKNSSPRGPLLGKKSVRLPLTLPTVAQSAVLKTPKHYRRFRSRSLPIINYTLRSQMSQPQSFIRFLASTAIHGSIQHHSSAKAPGHPSSASDLSRTKQGVNSAMFSHLHSVHSGTSLPPINLQSLKEIDLQEILKNPQLRHDILFDPQLQFRPNLDGERGRRKKSAIERYWHEIEVECKQFFYQPERGGVDAQLALKLMRLRALFSTLREILLSLLPMKDRLPVNEIIDIELIVQQLNYGLFDFVAMAKWLGDVFKSHCAPMRDLWVLDMISKFQQAFDESLVAKLVEGLRLIFSILEAMKLDVANHQIRILRPVLIETATDFEKDYFSQLITHCKIDISDSLKWFQRGYNKRQGDPPPDLLSVLSSLVIELLLCRNMATEFPSTLAFDHTRLVLLRADVRQLVCVQLCIVLFKQVSANYASVLLKPMCIKPETIVRLQEQILAIVTDDNGNVKWTRNVQAIALQVVKIVVNGDSAVDMDTLLQLSVPQPLVDFCYNWLLKQIQPSTEVYGLMEEKIFKELLEQITAAKKSCAVLSASSAAAQSLADPKTSGFNFLKQRKADSEMAGILLRISTLVKFHWSVFGDYYTEYVRLQSS